jgi:hypothetical protein
MISVAASAGIDVISFPGEGEGIATGAGQPFER